MAESPFPVAGADPPEAGGLFTIIGADCVVVVAGCCTMTGGCWAGCCTIVVAGCCWFARASSVCCRFITNRITIAANAMMPTTTAARTPPDTPFLSGRRTVSACSSSRRAVGVSTTTPLCSTSRSAIFVLLEDQLLNVLRNSRCREQSLFPTRKPNGFAGNLEERPIIPVRGTRRVGQRFARLCVCITRSLASEPNAEDPRVVSSFLSLCDTSTFSCVSLKTFSPRRANECRDGQGKTAIWVQAGWLFLTREHLPE